MSCLAVTTRGSPNTAEASAYAVACKGGFVAPLTPYGASRTFQKYDQSMREAGRALRSPVPDPASA